jgi:hypothetical protein
VLGFNSSFSVDRVGHCGGLAMFWHSSLNCQVLDYSQNHISIEVVDSDRGNWRLIGYYGYPKGGRRRASWDFLCNTPKFTNSYLFIYNMVYLDVYVLSKLFGRLGVGDY